MSLQLDDGREVMLYMFRRKDGTLAPQSAGSLIERDGRVRALPLSAFRVSAMGRWHSVQTAADYPSGWRLQLPSARLDSCSRPASRIKKSCRAPAPRIGKARSTFAMRRRRGERAAKATSS